MSIRISRFEILALVVAGSLIVLVGGATAWSLLPDSRFKREVQFRGSRNTCNVCGRTFGRWEQTVQTQAEARCPFCFSRPRHRSAYRYLRERTNLFDGKPKRMLHIAPEPFFAPIFKAIPNMDYISGDLDPSRAMMKIDVTEIPFPDNSFDVIYCSHVLEHVPDDRKAMRELYRVLKPGGWALIAVPILRSDKTYEDFRITDPKERERAFGQVDHVRAYGPDYLSRLRDAGCELHVDHFPQSFSYAERIRYGFAREDIHICRKPA